MSEEKKLKRRWVRFSLRTLLVLVAIVGAGFGRLGIKVRQAQRQRQAVEAVHALEGAVLYDFQLDAEDIPDLNRVPPGPTWMRKLCGDDLLGNVVTVVMTGTDANDEWLVHVDSLPQLNRLGLLGTRITDDGLIQVRALSQLKVLSLSGTQVTDAGLVHLHGLSQLKYLQLANTQVSDAACQQLEKTLPNLKILR